MANRGHFLRVNEHLGPLDWLASPNGRFFTMMQRDGNLVVYEGTPETGGEGLWAYSDFAREDDDYFAVMQGDGNLCVYRGTGPNDNRGNIWCTRPQALEERKDYVLVMQDDGNLCVYMSPPRPQNYVWGWMGLSSGTKELWEELEDFFKGVGSDVEGAWHETAQSVTAVADAVREAGADVGDAFIAGAEAAQSALATAAEVTREGLVEAGRYLEERACSIGVGSALTAAVTAVMAASGGGIVLAMSPAVSAGNSVALKSSMATLAYLLAEPISEIPIPGFDESREEMAMVLAFLLEKAFERPPAGGVKPGFVVGVVIYGLTQLICSGTLPNGYRVWRGAQAEIPRF